jgi:hypothetical protein
MPSSVAMTSAVAGGLLMRGTQGTLVDFGSIEVKDVDFGSIEVKDECDAFTVERSTILFPHQTYVRDKVVLEIHERKSSS